MPIVECSTAAHVVFTEQFDLWLETLPSEGLRVAPQSAEDQMVTVRVYGSAPAELLGPGNPNPGARPNKSAEISQSLPEHPRQGSKALGDLWGDLESHIKTWKSPKSLGLVTPG